ncbi:hypothetical protein TELCIR_21534 [Teladorsagia circumcincta]|uniref:Uncharacterized protein n=1 Tax=Teladorsagia circumcincta TaxID=45464 RepID=A0A2G9TGG9_TELCI|nr:hypothetical protein TELCIR_21534 [Teladorsagia circumcincta]
MLQIEKVLNDYTIPKIMKTLINVYEGYRESHPNDDIRIDGFTPPDYVKYIFDEYNASKDVERKNRASTSSVRFNYSQFMYEYHFGIHSKCYNSNDTTNVWSKAFVSQGFHTKSWTDVKQKGYTGLRHKVVSQEAHSFVFGKICSSNTDTFAKVE